MKIKTREKQSQKNTSWQSAARRYNQSIGLSGSYQYTNLLLPNTLRLLNLKPDSSLLDLGCGQGVLERAIPKEMDYTGIDNAPDLVDFARKYSKNPRHSFNVADLTRPLSLKQIGFSHAVFLLSLQNMKNGLAAINNAAHCLMENGRLLLVLNHPCFRIPRQSSWQIDEQNKLEFRRIDRYLSPLEIPINMNPGKNHSPTLTWSFHHSISDYSLYLKEAGLYIKVIEEWTSDKQSEGKMARMENRARAEFPLFMAILAQKKP